MTSVERVITYTQIEGEPGYKNDHQPPDNWPQHGQVRINNLGLVYYLGGPKILKDLSFREDWNCWPHWRWPSFAAALFRIPQPTGTLLNVNIASINIQRSHGSHNPESFSASLHELGSF